MIEQLISDIKEHGDNVDGVYYPASQQIHPLPTLYCGDEKVGVSFYIEDSGLCFFVEEMPGNINGSVFHVYCDNNKAIKQPIAKRIKSTIRNNQDAVGIIFHMVDLELHC